MYLTVQTDTAVTQDTMSIIIQKFTKKIIFDCFVFL